jgi:sarcosine oxidase / L-pipecolate oxidase
MKALVVGGGIFGVTAALELSARGAAVTLLEAGTLPNPLAESTDISKAVRMDYGADEEYAVRMERALVAWRSSKFFHETGLLYLSQGPMKPGGFEHDSFQVLTRLGKNPQRLDSAAIRARFPAWNAERFVDGYFNPVGGWAESGKVVAALAAEARLADVQIVENARTDELMLRGDRVVGAVAGGHAYEADEVVVAAGAWTPILVPWLAACFKRAAQPVFHLEPADPSRFVAERFPTFGADIATTGYYGFPLHPTGVLKIAHHGPGRDVSPDDPRTVLATQERELRDFLRWAFPELTDAPLAASRTCVYCDTRDEHFWIAKDPKHPGLTVAAGGSGHAFKFAPLLGAWIADAVEEKPNPELHKFRWRPEIAPARGEEAARQHVSDA